MFGPLADLATVLLSLALLVWFTKWRMGSQRLDVVSRRSAGTDRRPAMEARLEQALESGWGKTLLRSLSVGAALGLGVSVSMTVRDWWLNPSGIFHGDTGTDWTIVAETATSWFWPVTAVATACALGVFWLRTRHNRTDSDNELPPQT